MIDRIERMLARGRAAILCMNCGQRASLALSLRNALAASGDRLLRFSFPENPDRFPGFVNGAMNVVAEEASSQYCSRYPGVLLVEIDEESYIRTDMPMAFLELMSQLTRMRLVIVCGSEALKQHMLECAGQFTIPGVVELAEAAPHTAMLLKHTAQRLGLQFADRSAVVHATKLFDQLSALPAFNADVFVRSLAEAGGRITSVSIQLESNDPGSYVRACKALLKTSNGKNPGKGAGKIGFLTGDDRDRMENLNERSA